MIQNQVSAQQTGLNLTLTRRLFSALFLLIFVASSLFPVLPSGPSASTHPVPAPVFSPLQNQLTLVPTVQTPAVAAETTNFLPPGMAALPEVPGSRSAETATYQSGKNSYVSVIGADPLYYRDSRGGWQVIDAVFQPYQDGYLADRNSIRSRAGSQKAWLSAAVDQTALVWESISLWAALADGQAAIPLASVLPQAALPAKVAQGGALLDYTGGWSDPTLAEQITSAPGQVEHSLILNQPPAAAGAPQSLELRTTLSLVPADSLLWADGQAQSGAFETSAGFEIRTKDNLPVIDFEPVRAYEAGSPAHSVLGSYRFEPGPKPGLWTVSVRTPWAWWVEPARQYPAVLDPVIKVNTSTGNGDGLAWVINKADADYNSNFTYGGIFLGVLGGHGFDSVTEGYMQFNSLPAVLYNAPVKIKAAYLDVEPTGFFRPAFEYYPGKNINWADVDVSRSTSLYYVGACPGAIGCTNEFSIHDNRLLNTTLYNWTLRPIGLKVGTSLPLTLGGPEISGKRTPKVTTWDVTSQMAAWYNAFYNNPGARPYPTFRLAFDDGCAGPPFVGNQSAKVPNCMGFDMGSGSVRLRIEYDALPVNLGDNLFNTMGVPSYLDGVFEDSGHFYQLAAPTQTHWRAVAVRGNHANPLDLQPAWPTRTALKMWQNNATPTELTSATTQSADETAFILVDDFTDINTGIKFANLQAEVIPSDENDFARDLSRNYRLDYQSAAAISPPYGTPFQTGLLLPSDRLITMAEFHLSVGDKLLLNVDVSANVQVALASPTGATDTASAVVSSRSANLIMPTSTNSTASSGITRSTFEFGIGVDGTWALVLINQASPQVVKNTLVNYAAGLDMLICAIGAIPTFKHGCQPLRLPDASIPPSKTWNGLTIYSEGGFNSAGPYWCTTNEAAGAPIIGPAIDGRYVYVAQGSICLDSTIGLWTTIDSAVGLTVRTQPFDPANTLGDYLLVYGSGSEYLTGGPTGRTVASVQTPDDYALLPFLMSPDIETRRNLLPFNRYWKTQTAHISEKLSLARMKMEAVDRVTVPVTIDAAQAPVTIIWDVTWEDYPGANFLATGAVFSSTLLQQTAFSMPIALSSTDLRIFGSSADADGIINYLDSQQKPGGPEAYQFRAAKARLTLADSMGGASKDVQVVVQPPGMQRLPAAEKACSFDSAATSCLDLRRSSSDVNQSYNWNEGAGENNVQQWDLPDVHITDTAALVSFSEPGKLDVYSSDHPYATAAGTSFSFDTWGAKVSVREEPCEAGGQVTTVVRGSTSISLPMIGDDGSSSSPGITAAFKLCNSDLKQTKLSLAIPAPGIPIGNSGLGVYAIDGEVTIGPASTKIVLGLNMGTMDGATITNGRGELTIDTAGMFSMSGTATVIGVLKGQALLQVAWSPLDLLMEGQVSYVGGFISGYLRMHTWMGQGFQHKYPWLPDDSSMHFSGSIGATLTIQEGVLIDEWIFHLPPFDIGLSMQVSFGEFCAAGGCSKYEWGISGTVSVFGYDVGVYVNSGGPELILGSSDHTLIDQYASPAAQQVAAQPPSATLAPQSAVVQTQLPGSQQPNLYPIVKTSASAWTPVLAASSCSGSGTVQNICPFVVQAGTGRALWVVNWQNGILDVALEKPDGTLITPANAAANGVEITTPAGAHQVAFAAKPTSGKTIPAGAWKIRLDNVYTGTQDYLKNNYQLMFSADPPGPDVQWLTLLSGATTPDVDGFVSLEWLATRNGAALPADAMVQFFILPLKAIVIDKAGSPISAPMSANLGAYKWKASGLRPGSYYVGARIDDRKNGNGTQIFWSPGYVNILDSTPPPAPSVVGTLASSLDGSIVVIWLSDTVTPDLAGYQVEYTIPLWDVSGTPLQRVRKMIPQVKNGFLSFESVRLGGMRPGFTSSICVRAFDAAGNLSGCTATDKQVGEGYDSRIGAPSINSLSVSANHFNLSYSGPASASLAGYFITYAPAGCMLPEAARTAVEGASPIKVAKTVTSLTLTGLTIGQTYLITVYAYAANGDVSPGVSRTMMLINPADGNGNRIPDQWETLFGITDVTADDDQDGLNNTQEYLNGSIPLWADSDQDGFYDGNEVELGFDPCSLSSKPDTQMKPKLTLSGSAALVFKISKNQPKKFTQTIQITNLGFAPLVWSATPSQPWITLSLAEGVGPAELQVGIDLTGLSPGFYSGKIIIQGGSGALAQQSSSVRFAGIVETMEIPISLTVEPTSEITTYLPLIVRQAP